MSQTTNFPLGEWAKGQRADYNRGRLNDERIRFLEQSHPTWAWNLREDAWENALQHLREYAAEFGDALVAAKYICPDGFPLGRFVNKQRTMFARGKMPEDRKKRLEGVEGWSWDPNEDKRAEGYEHVDAFFKESGGVRPERKHVSQDGYAVGKWLDAQRAAYRRGNLSPERIERLNRFSDWL